MECDETQDSILRERKRYKKKYDAEDKDESKHKINKRNISKGVFHK